MAGEAVLCSTGMGRFPSGFHFSLRDHRRLPKAGSLERIKALAVSCGTAYFRRIVSGLYDDLIDL